VETAIAIILIIAIGYFLFKLSSKNSTLENGDLYDKLHWGELNEQAICPHCQAKGSVRYKDVKRKKGISGGKATAAVFTLGISMLATGLSRKEGCTQAHCMNCNSTWNF
jgi:hypothetical protein